MDIWGVAGVEAEAELLSAVVTCFQNLGLTSSDVGIKVSEYVKTTLIAIDVTRKPLMVPQICTLKKWAFILTSDTQNPLDSFPLGRVYLVCKSQYNT
jgi:hypothetical protein